MNYFDSESGSAISSPEENGFEIAGVVAVAVCRLPCFGTFAGIFALIKTSVNTLVTNQAEAIKRDFTKQLNEYMEENGMY